MKKIFLLTGFVLSSSIFAQVIIGTGRTAPSSSSVLLEFGTENKGIIVPYVESLPTGNGATPGTIVFDTTDKKMKYRKSTSWVDLSNGGSLNNTKTDATNIITNLQDSQRDEIDAISIIGKNSSAADGILVLESTTKAMVLPTVADYTDIVNPSPGMMIFINKTGAKRLAIYNGDKWSFWKP